MEISKSLHEEIVTVQQKLQRAILEHQTCVERQQSDPNNPDLHAQKKKIQVYIVSLGRCQKQSVQRLRNEVDALKADNANGSKVSIPSLLGLNNNNHITNNNETKHEAAANGFETKPSKENYEEVVRNGDVHRSRDKDCEKLRSSSVETVSGEDDVVEVSLDENSDDKQEEEAQKEHNIETSEKYNYLNCLGLITKSKCMELQNRRVERKRRSTANPQFVYSMFEQPSKRKRHSYLQSGNAPHTRQTTARMNGPSPPPNKTQPTKSTSPPAQTVTKSLYPVHKSTTRPNILRNADSKVFVNKNKMEDNQVRLSVSSAKSVQSIGNKVVHIPGLPSSLTIERIGSDSIVCICCENPGSLTTCRNCSSNYHISCHTRSTPPPRICPKCISSMDEEEDIEKDEEANGQEVDNKLLRYKKDEKLAATTNASGLVGKAREDPEVYKASGGLYKVDTTQKKYPSTVFGVNQLPASTFLIPINTNDISVSNVNKSEDSKLTPVFDNEYRQATVLRDHVVNHYSRISYVKEDQVVASSHSYQLPSTTVQSEKHQSYFIIKKITEPTGRSNQSSSGETEEPSRTTVFNYQLPTSCGTTIQAGFQPVVTHPLFYDRNNSKKQTNRAVPLHRVIVPKLPNSLHPVSNDHQLDRATLNGRKPWAKFARGDKLCVDQSAGSSAEIILSPYGDAENSDDEQQRPGSTGSAEEAAATASRDDRGKCRSRNFIYSLFPSHNKSHTVTDGARESRGFGANDRDCPLLRQQLCREEHELELHEQPDSKPAAVQLERRALTRFFEHVKLEEAHISAPLRTKLAHEDEVGDDNDDDDDEIAREDSPRDEQYDDGGTVAKAPLLTSCDDLDEDRLISRVAWLHEDWDIASDDGNVASKAAVRRLSDAVSTQSGYELARVNRRCSSVTPRHSAEREDDRLTTAAAALRIAQNNLSELRNEVSVPDDKADTERQDLPSGRRLRSRSNSSSSGHSDTPAQAMNVNDLSDEFNILAMGLVSPGERGEELEQVGDESTASETDAATG
ncbi:PREDICTED: uncharacterized protein LOC105562151 isoform X2 [Vollenhovia emeryi]|uniref:uncharacterized protein LOC105562151 isoform X2 n=1 Tax=Vollenhovia emeryi TaxID=411798 RepID=UPI0005F41FC2|nr:PREDICTED: uncharacterized protein LOC105562151 isoform X2 [Vollenhovia emeryi]